MAVEYQLRSEGSKQAEAGGHANCLYFVQRLVVKNNLEAPDLNSLSVHDMVQIVNYAPVLDDEPCKIYRK